MRPDPDTHRSRPNSNGSLSRRTLLQCTGWLMTAAVVPFRTCIAAEVEYVSPIMVKLSTYMSEAGNRALPDDVVEEAKHHILDTLGSMVSGSNLPAGRAAIRFARSYGGEKVATVIASNVLCGPIEAALANAQLAHADETDDSHAPSVSHPGCSIVPA